MPNARRTLILTLTFTSLASVLSGPAQAQGQLQNEVSQIEARIGAQIQQVQTITAKLPRVNVTHGDFGQGCANPADPMGNQDSTCAIQHAIQFAETNPIKGGGYPVLYFPHGRYRVAGSGFAPALVFTTSVSMVGDGAQSTTIYNDSPTAGTVAYNNAQECASKPGPCFLEIEGITFGAGGHQSRGGLIELNSSNTGLMRDVVMANTGGIALNLQGSTERWIFSQMEIHESRWAILSEGDTNENYFDRVNVLNTGQDSSHYCYSVNCPNGRPIQTGTWLPDPHSAVYLDGDNVHWMNSSIKSTQNVGGIRLAPVTSSVSHSYIEGFNFPNQMRSNHAIEVGGKLELGHITQGIGPGDLTIPVDDAGWQPLYVNDPATVNLNGDHAGTPAYTIFPADYLVGNTDPSRAVPGITRGTTENITVASFAGDGAAHLRARGAKGTRAIAWPAGSIIEQVPQRSYGTARVESNHLNSLASDASNRYTSGCDDTAMLTQWTSNPSRLCAEIIVGLVPDGYGVPIPARGVRPAPPYAVDVVDNSIFTGGSEAMGEGWMKIASNANLNLNQGDGPLRNFTSADTALNTYINSNTRVQVVKWPDTSALAVVHDLSANVSFSPQDHYYSADMNLNHSLSHQYLGEQCWYPIASGNQQPTSRFCVRTSGAAQENLVNGKWVGAGGR